jgi:hypothetical protein
MATTGAFRASSRRRSTAKPTPKRKAKIPQAFCSTEDPHGPGDQILQPGDLDTHLLVEVHQDHPEQGKPRRMSRVCRRWSLSSGESCGEDSPVGGGNDTA